MIDKPTSAYPDHAEIVAQMEANAATLRGITEELIKLVPLLVAAATAGPEEETLTTE